MIRILLPTLLLLLAAVPAHALDPVDDFENGQAAFISWQAYQEHTVQIPGYTGHAMHSNRKIILAPDASGLGVVNIGNSYSSVPFADRAMIVTALVGTSNARVQWEWGYSRDITYLGQVDRIEMVVKGPSDGQITAILSDGTVGEGITLPTSGGIEVLTFYFSDWTGPDPTAAQILGFRFDAFSDSDESYRVSEIRFRRTHSLNVDIFRNFLATQVPPIPSSPLAFSLLDTGGNPQYRTDMVIQSAVAGGVVEVSAELGTRDGAAGKQATMAFSWDENSVFLDTNFTLAFDFTSVNGFIPEIYPPDPIQDDPTSFALRFPVCLRNGAGTSMGVSNTLLTFDVDPSQGAEFPSFTVTPRYAAATAGANQIQPLMIIGFDLNFDYIGTSGVEVYEPLFHATWISDWTPVATTGTPLAPTVDDAMRVSVWPSVTQGAVDVRSNRPFAEDARITVHDINGRLVQSLKPAVGTRAMQWNGTGASGSALPAGVYFVRVVDQAGSAVTRLTRLR